MDIYPVVCYKVDEFGSLVEVGVDQLGISGEKDQNDNDDKLSPSLVAAMDHQYSKEGKDELVMDGKLQPSVIVRPVEPGTVEFKDKGGINNEILSNSVSFNEVDILEEQYKIYVNEIDDENFSRLACEIDHPGSANLHNIADQDSKVNQITNKHAPIVRLGNHKENLINLRRIHGKPSRFNLESKRMDRSINRVKTQTVANKLRAISPATCRSQTEVNSSRTASGGFGDLAVWKQPLICEDPNLIQKIRKPIGCLYRCLSYGMFKNVDSHKQIRCNIIGNIVNNWDLHKDYATSVNRFYKSTIDTKEDYINYMIKDGVQGGFLELKVATTIFNVYVDLINVKTDLIYRYGFHLNTKEKILLIFDPDQLTFDFVTKRAFMYKVISSPKKQDDPLSLRPCYFTLPKLSLKTAWPSKPTSAIPTTKSTPEKTKSKKRMAT